MKMKATNNYPRMLAVRAPRESCLAFYSKFTKIKTTYLAATNFDYKPSVSIKNNKFNLQVKPFVFSLFSKKVNNLSHALIKDLDYLIQNTDIVNITDTYYSFNAQSVFLAKKYKKFVVCIIWANIASHPSSWIFPYSLYTKMVVKNTDLFILRNKLAYKFTDSLGIERKKTALIYKGVDLKHFFPRKLDKSHKKEIIILYVGIYHQSKGVIDLINAFERLVINKFKVKLYLAGRGNLKSYIQSKAKTLPIKDFGFVNYKNLAKLYRQADIFCSPSKEIKVLGHKIWHEYFSYTLMEAQASGLPIVSTKSGGIVEEVDSSNPLVNIGDIDMLFNALRKLIVSRKMREKLSKINRQRAELLFDAQKQAQKTEDAIIKAFTKA